MATWRRHKRSKKVAVNGNKKKKRTITHNQLGTVSVELIKTILRSPYRIELHKQVYEYVFD